MESGKEEGRDTSCDWYTALGVCLAGGGAQLTLASPALVVLSVLVLTLLLSFVRLCLT